MTSGLGAVVTYALLAALWGVIVVVYARQWPSTKGETTLRLMLALLIAEAVRTFVESVFFGLLWGANYGVFPAAFKPLGEPVFLSSVKAMTLLLGVVVLLGVARIWLPTELSQRRAQRDAEEALRRQLEVSLRESREREAQLRLVSEASRDGIWEDDLRTGQITLSPRFWEMMGLAAGDAREWNEHVHPEDKQRVRDAYRGYVEGTQPRFDVRYRFLHPDGRTLHFHARALTTRDEDGTPARLVGFARDITADVEAEEARVQTQKLEGLGVLAGGLAHDFNNLLTAMKSSLSVMEAQSRRGESLEEPLSTAQQAVTRAAALTRQLLAYAGRTNLSQHPLDLNHVVQDIGALLKATMPKGVTLQQELAASLPGVLGDDGQLQQAVMNLITNAAEALDGKEGTVRLRTESLVLETEPPGARTPMPRGRVVCLTVEDTGCGMSPEVMKRMFDPFFTTRGVGRGLGLAALSGILRKHGSGITVHSEPGRGTTCRVYFPALAAPVAPPVEKPQRSGKLSARVLLVDDEALIRRSAARLLVMLGCTVEEAGSGDDAVKRVTASPAAFDVVLMDLTMPGMDGFEATRRIGEVAPGLPVVVSSGYTAVDLPPQLPPSTRSLAKPYDVGRLEALLKEVTGVVSS
ncbi:MAG: hybrid sensor histidine kinase/response regulator [Archangium sp.]